MQKARYCLSLIAVAALTCGLGGNIPMGSANAENGSSTPSQITAVYQVSLAGFNLGDFRLTTAFHGDDYEMHGEARFSVLQGLIYAWHGITAGTGHVTSAGPRPTMYALSYSDSDKSGTRLRMTFDQGDVTAVSIIPNKRPIPHTIPVTKEQLEDVVDPMSGAFLSAHSDNPNGDLGVCKQTLQMFDGVARFDLVITPKRAVAVKRSTPTGYGGPAVVCGVKFIPIAGYLPDDPGIRLMAESNEIEVWLMPVRGTDMYVPYRIVLPTLAGTGAAEVTSLQVSGARRASTEP